MRVKWRGCKYYSVVRYTFDSMVQIQYLTGKTMVCIEMNLVIDEIRNHACAIFLLLVRPFPINGQISGRKTNPVLFFMVFIGTSIPSLLDMACGNTSFDIHLMTSKRMQVTAADF